MVGCGNVHERIPLLGICDFPPSRSFWRELSYRKTETGTDDREYTERSFRDSTSSGREMSDKEHGSNIIPSSKSFSLQP